jgi:methylmalonyl-CoA/ethylmalonyl-CoA epimerase
MKFHHVGIFVASLDSGLEYFRRLGAINEIGTQRYRDELNAVEVCFFRGDGGPLVELVAGIGEVNPVKHSLQKGVNIVNHMAYETDRFDAKIVELVGMGHIVVQSPRPAVAFGGRRICFLMSPVKIMLELIEQ